MTRHACFDAPDRGSCVTDDEHTKPDSMLTFRVATIRIERGAQQQWQPQERRRGS